MRSLLQQLENNEAVLLMYLADELPAEDRAEVEQLLASDGGLRSALESLRQAQRHMTLALSEADGLACPPVTEAARQQAATRRMSRAMVQFQLEREKQSARELAGKPSRSLHLPRWSYPFAAAAMLLIAWVGYWGSTTGDPGISSSSGRGADIYAHHPHHFDHPDSIARDNEDEGYVPPLAVQQSDRDLLAISAGVYDVSSMFEAEHE